MEFKEMGMNNVDKKLSPLELAQKFEKQLVQVLAEKYVVDAEDLKLVQKEKSSYFSEEDPNVLCCLILGLKNGHLYVVTAEVQADGKEISNIKSDILS